MLKKFVILLLLHTVSLFAASPAPVKGQDFMVVSAHREATKIGFEILAQGGNAIDAAVAMGYALAVVHPCCGNLGGGGFMLIRFASGKSIFINFREKAPQNISPSQFLDPQGHVIKDYLSTGHGQGLLSKPYLSVGVPGTVMGLNRALEKYGTLSLRQVIQPALALAEQGYILTSGDAQILKIGEKAFRRQPNVSRIFLKKDKSYQPGDRLVQKDLATTLKTLMAHGSQGFYQGAIAKEIVKASHQHHGLLTLADFNHYTIEEQQPITCHYRGYQVITSPPPGSGVTLCEALQVLQAFPLAEFGFHSALASHYMVEALRFAYADRNQKLGDPTYVDNPVKTLLSPGYTHKLIQQISSNQASKNSYPINQLKENGDNTTAYVVVDQFGNAVSVTYTLNDYFGAKVIPGQCGFFLNNELADFTIKPDTANTFGLYQGPQNNLAPNKRPLSSMTPTILVKNHRLAMVLGTPGGSTIPSQLLNAIINVIDFKMNIQEAENAPRFHMQSLPNKIYYEPFTFSKDTLNILTKMGYAFQLGSPYGTLLWGGIAGIIVQKDTLFGAMDSRQQSGCAMGK